LALIYGAALAGTQTALGPRIAENRRQETYAAIPELVGVVGEDEAGAMEIVAEDQEDEDGQRIYKILVGDVVAGWILAPVVPGEDGREQRVYKVLAADKAIAGWVLPATGQGFADRIDVLIGVTANVSTITGLYVLDQKETPDLGSRITGEAFRDQFRDMPTDRPVEVVPSAPGAGQIRAARTGATISSQSVADIVNRTIANLKTPLRKLQEEGGQRPPEP